jgi:hypothetical protein
MLIGRAFHLGERFKHLPIIVPTLHRSMVFLLLLVVLTFLEEIIVGAIHGRTVWEPIDEIAGGTFQHVAATIFIIFLILFPTSHSARLVISSVTGYLFGCFSSGVVADEVRNPGRASS